MLTPPRHLDPPVNLKTHLQNMLRRPYESYIVHIFGKIQFVILI